MSKTKARAFNIILGSNMHQNSGGIIRVRGQEVLKVERGGDNSLLVSTEIRDEKGTLLGKIVHNSFVHVGPECDNRGDFDKGRLKRLELNRKSDGRQVFSLEVKDEDTMEITGVFWVKGVKLDAQKDRLLLPNGTVLSRNTFRGNGTDILIQ